VNGFFTVAAAAAGGIGNGSCGGVNFIGDDDFGDSDLLLDGDCDLGLAAAAGGIGNGSCGGVNFIGDDDDFGDSDLLLDGDCDLGLAAAAGSAGSAGSGGSCNDVIIVFVGGGGCAATISTAAADRELNLCRLCRRGGGGAIGCDTVKLCAAAAAGGIGNGSCGGVNFIGDDDFGDSDLLLDGDCDLGLAASAAANLLLDRGCDVRIIPVYSNFGIVIEFGWDTGWESGFRVSLMSPVSKLINLMPPFICWTGNISSPVFLFK
jgi:hypothetical protein